MPRSIVSQWSTISYNSFAFLLSVLDTLLLSHKIEHYYLIKHLAESDGKKDHFHVFVSLGCGFKNNDFLDDCFLEHDSSSDLFLRCMPWRKTNVLSEWLLYSCHHKKYLEYKHLNKKYHYSFDDFVVSDREVFENDVDSALEWLDSVYKPKPFEVVSSYIVSGKTFADMLLDGVVPIQQIKSYELAWIYLSGLKE